MRRVRGQQPSILGARGAPAQNEGDPVGDGTSTRSAPACFESSPTWWVAICLLPVSSRRAAPVIPNTSRAFANSVTMSSPVRSSPWERAASASASALARDASAVGRAALSTTIATMTCTTPVAIRSTAPRNAIGSRMRIVLRTRSTQKLPSVSLRVREKPLTSATATAIPTAADRKFCTASPGIWAVKPSVCSPEYDCQSVSVTNEMAVLNDVAGLTPGKPRPYGRGA
jgi:hypothetical protein